MRLVILLLTCLLGCSLGLMDWVHDGTCINQDDALIEYVKTHQSTPEAYLLSKFKDHDIIFLGEMHRVKHDVLFVQSLIPKLYRAGIHNLGIEFANADDQANIDRLITAKTYDEDLARQIGFHQYVLWGYKEYLDIYRAAWTLNRSLPQGAPKFRIVGLNYSPKWKLLTGSRDTLTDERRSAIFYNGDGDEFMGKSILRELVMRGQKALIYSGMHHAFTRYRQPVYNYAQKKLYRLMDNRMGNVVAAQIGVRAFTIFLHSPWMSKDSAEQFRPPIGGAIDRLMVSFPNRALGFDTVGTPLGKLTDPNCYYAIGHDEFKLEDFCDGYIYLKTLQEYMGVTVDPLFITAKNYASAVDGIPNFQARKYYKDAAAFNADMKKDADVPALFRAWGVFSAAQKETHLDHARQP